MLLKLVFSVALQGSLVPTVARLLLARGEERPVLFVTNHVPPDRA